MKKITFLVVLAAIFFDALQIKAQINEPANWPNTDWQVTGTYDLDYPEALNDPSVESNFSWNDDLPDGSIYDRIGAESPEIDITAATTASPLEEQLVVSGSYVFAQSGDVLTLEWWDNDSLDWLPWDTFVGNSTSLFDFANCNNLQPFESVPLIISSLTPSQLEHFKYRFFYDDNGHTYGFCIGSPTIYSQVTPSCFAVSDINADVTLISDSVAVIDWNDNNSVNPDDGWEVEFGPAGYTQGTGTLTTTLLNPYTINGLSASTCYDVYIRALCNSVADVKSDWVGPYNFCTTIEVPVCGGFFYDRPGPNRQYEDSVNETTTICSTDTADVVTIIFDAFELENNKDFLKIYDGNSSASPQIGPVNGYTGTNSPGMITANIVNGGCLTFVFTSDAAGRRDGWEARVLCSHPITCFIPEDLAVNESSISIHTAEISWTDTNTTSPQSDWEVEYGPAGFTQGSGTLVAPATNPVTLTGLDPATEYCYYVKAVCGASSGDEDSFWGGPACFTTLCDVFPAPYTENFENGGDIPTCWLQGSNNTEDWMFSNDFVTANQVGNSGVIPNDNPLTRGYFAWVDDDNPNGVNTYLLSPFIDLTGLASPALGFNYVSNGGIFNTYINFSVDVWNGTTWTEDVFTHNVSDGTTLGWEQALVDLNTPTFIGQTIQIRFVANELNPGVFDDFAIDDVFVGEMPTCVNVNSVTLDSVGITDATLTWSDGNSPVATNWQVAYGAPGFDPYSVTPFDTNNNISYTQGGLDSQTDYELYIRANCGVGGFSLWVGPVSFTTLCTIFDAPYLEDFEDGGMLDACWAQNDGLDNWMFSNIIDGDVGDTFNHVGNNGFINSTHTISDNYYAFVDADNPSMAQNAITTPLVNITPLTAPVLSFYQLSHNEGGANVQFSVDIWDGTAWVLNFHTNSQNTVNNQNLNGWQEIVLDLSPASGLNITGPIQVRFVVDDTNGSAIKDDFAIDDVELREAPSCWPIYSPIISNETTTTVDVAWTDSGNDASTTTYTIEYGSVGFTLGTGTQQTVLDADSNGSLDNPYTVTGLDVESNWDFYVIAHCPNGDSSIGPVQGTTLPACFDLTGINVSGETTTTVDVSWTDSNDATTTTYTIEYGVVGFIFGEGTQQTVLDADSNGVLDNPYTVTGLDVDSDWDFYVIAHCPDGDSYFGPVQGTTLPTCLEVTGITTVSVGEDTVGINWIDNNTPSPPGGWDIEVVFPTFPQGSGAPVNVTTLPYTITGLIPSSTYEVYIRANCAVDGSDPSRWTGPFTINTQVRPPHNDTCATATEIVNIGASCMPILGNNRLATQTTPALATNCYDPVFDTAAYDINDVWYKFTYPSNGSLLIETGFAGGIAMEDSVMAVYRADDLTNECGSLVFAHSYNSDGTTINYAYQTCKDDSDISGLSSNDSNLYSKVLLRNQTPGDVFYVRVWSYDGTVRGDDNVPGQFTICITANPVLNRNALNTNDSTLENIKLNYYPNPTSNILNLQASSEITEVYVYSVLGQEVSKEKFNSVSVNAKLDISMLSTGTYFVKVLFDNNMTKTIKIVKK